MGGSMLAAAMARNGVRVLVLEAGVHPKFSIGESMILETSEIMRSIARVFDVPELEYFSAENFLPAIGTSHGVKRHFSFLPHRAGAQPDPADLIEAVIPRAPYGHELHIYRQDSDYFLLTTAVRYGANVLQNKCVEKVDIGADGVVVATTDGEQFSADYVVDAGGFRSILATQTNARRYDLRTHTRGLFTHMTGVEPFPSPQGEGRNGFGVPYALSEGTHHHVFDGGWMWIIPFNNHCESTNPLCSVGLMLDPRRHPERADVTADEEFWEFVQRYPAINAHLNGARPVREWVRSGRIQYSSTQSVGDRYCLIGHAAGFIDPLFSKGLYTTLASLFSFGKTFLQARVDGDFSRARFKTVEQSTLRYVEANDRLVANALKSFAAPDLWRQFSVIWILGAYLELVGLTTYRCLVEKNTGSLEERISYPMPDLSLVGGGYAPFNDLANFAYELVEGVASDDEAAMSAAARTLRDRIQAEHWIPYSHREISLGKRHLPKAKFTARLFRQKGGPLGDGDFREHFFDGINAVGLARFLARDARRYSRKSIARQYRTALKRGI